MRLSPALPVPAGRVFFCALSAGRTGSSSPSSSSSVMPK
nr:MAG TPA: hypothetical protein [Caudoviricetes sp.]